jgi:O-antigen biosynthesis protein
MNTAIIEWLMEMRARHIPTPGDVLEVGSRDINGSPREVFMVGSKSYTGVDALPGKGVDQVFDITEGFEGTPLQDRKFDTVLCTEMLEHCTDPCLAVRVMRYMLKPYGHLILTSPANGFPDHKDPRDYWRLMPDIYTDVLLRGMHILEHTLVRFDQRPDLYAHCWLAQL